ncbi:MAG: glycosyltransferase family 4 protein, partial [Planctomycetes bacterium]|nr:glycosyltransferase family 4 protein [Planctomycetota bacterium]
MWRLQVHRVAPTAPLRVIENAVSVPMQVTERCHDGPCRFMLLARMDEWKGIDDLLHACALLAREGLSYELALAGPAGTAGDRTTLEHEIADRGLAGMVRYLGPVLGPDKEELLEWADAYVQPSHHEGMPISLLEALAHALPCVATRVGAVPEVITDQREGLLVSPHQPAELAEAMRELIVDADRRRALGSAAAALALARFGMDRFRRDLIGLYDELLATPSVRTEGGWPCRECVPSTSGATTLADGASTCLRFGEF